MNIYDIADMAGVLLLMRIWSAPVWMRWHI